MRDRSAPLTKADIARLDWLKMDGLMPALVQNSRTGEVLMLGYMDVDALAATLGSGFATFYSRSKKRLWRKGETSGNGLEVDRIFADCDGDALLVLVRQQGPACHLGTPSCFEADWAAAGWLGRLSAIIREHAETGDSCSYTRQLLDDGLTRIAQKVGEEGVEVALAAVTGDAGACAGEVADLVYHLSVLFEAIGLDWEDVFAILRERHSTASK